MIGRFSLLLIPLLGWSVTFQTLSDRVYENAIEKLENDAAIQSSHYSKTIALSHDPVNIALSSRKIRGDDSADNGYEYGLMSEWTFKMPQLSNAQSEEWDIIRKNLAHQGNILRRIVDVDLKHEWLKYEIASARGAIYREKAQLSEKAYESGKKQHMAGRMSKMELMRLESESLKSKEDMTKAQMEAEHVQHVLREKSMSHDPVHIDDLKFEYIRDYGAVNTVIDQSPALESIKMRMAEIDAQIHTARQSRFESFSVGIGVTQEPTQKSMDFSVSIPISWQNRYENTTAALMSQRSALEHQKNNVHTKIRLGIEALSEHLKEREEMIRKSDETHKQYEILFSMAQKAFEGGVITQFEYLATKREYYDARLRSVDLREEYIDEMYELESRLGGVL